MMSLDNRVKQSRFVGAQDLTTFCQHPTSVCVRLAHQVAFAAKGETGPDGYNQEAYCRNAVLDRNGSDVLNR